MYCGAAQSRPPVGRERSAAIGRTIGGPAVRVGRQRKTSVRLFGPGVVITAVAVIGCVAIATPSAKGARWTKPEKILSPSKAVVDVDVVAGPDRYAVTGWRRGRPTAAPATSNSRSGMGRVFVSVRGRQGRRFGRPHALTRRGVRSWRLGASADGQTIVTWVNAAGAIQARVRTPTSGWSSAETIARAGVFGHSLSVAFDGTAIVKWHEGVDDEVLKVAVRPPHGSFGTPQTIATDDRGVWGAVAAGSGERGAVVWGGECPLADPEARTNYRASFVVPVPLESSGSGWSPDGEILNSKCPDAGFELALDDRGGAVLVINGSLRSWSGIRAAVRPPDGSFGPAELISRRGQVADFAVLGVDGEGRTVVTWPVFKAAIPNGTQSSVRPPGGEFSRPRRISEPLTDLALDLAVSRSGHALTLGQSLRGGFRLMAAYMRPGGRFGQPERVSPRLPRQELAQPRVAINAAGKALAAWTRPGARGGEGVFVAKRAPNCRGVEATILGKRGDRVLRGTLGRDVIVARGGRDRIRGRGGDDLICAGGGNDVVEGGRGDDRIVAGPGSDAVWGGTGEDVLVGGPGGDKLAGGAGADRLLGGRGPDRMNGSGGRDLCVGGRPRKDVGRPRSVDLADRRGCQEIRSARSIRVRLRSRPVLGG